jgi:hypothetical protein
MRKLFFFVVRVEGLECIAVSDRDGVMLVEGMFSQQSQVGKEGPTIRSISEVGVK